MSTRLAGTGCEETSSPRELAHYRVPSVSSPHALAFFWAAFRPQTRREMLMNVHEGQ